MLTFREIQFILPFLLFFRKNIDMVFQKNYLKIIPLFIMKELINRFFSKPLLAFEILTATFFVTILTLAMPLYVIQILNRYVSYGFHGTLITLTIGMLIALVLQLGFRLLRAEMASAVNQGPNNLLSFKVLSIISQAKAEPLSCISKQKTQEALNDIQTIHNSYDAQILTTVIDAPFSLLFIGVTYLLSPVLALIAIIGILIGAITGWLTVQKAAKETEFLTKESNEHRALNYSTVNAIDTVRAFGAVPFLHNKWEAQLKKLSSMRKGIIKELSQSLTISGSTLMSVALYAIGAVNIIQGNLTIGALIGANILTGKAYQNINSLTRIGFQLNKAKQAFESIKLFEQLPLENDKGSFLKEFEGQLDFQDLSFSYPNTSGPLFESLNLSLSPGNVLAVVGGNGTGKTTLAKLILRLLDPKRGNILADHVNIQQFTHSWWRQQIIYIPQEPTFLNGTIKDNILFTKPDITDDKLELILNKTNLKPFLDMTPNGLDTQVVENAMNLPAGIRKRLSLARGMITDGKLAILDEPTNALDEQGTEAAFQIMNDFLKAKKTIIIFSNDPKILKAASIILDLNHKPKPLITTHGKIA